MLTMQLFKIGQLNAFLFCSGSLVQSFQTNLGRSLEIDEAMYQEPVCKLLQEKRMPVLIDVPFDITEGTIFKKILCKDIPGWKC